MDNKITKVIGTVTAYGDAVKAGYQGSREDWIRLQMQSGVNAQRAETAANAADASAQRAAVSEANAAETLENIPADYTELVQEVGKLSEEIADELGMPFEKSGMGKVECESREGSALGVVIELPLRQEGAGEPAPDNARPFRLYNGIDIVHRGLNLFGGIDFVNALADDTQSNVDLVLKTVMYNPATHGSRVLFDKFDTKKQYTIILRALTTASNGSLNVKITYTDDSVAAFQFTECVNKYADVALVTDANKTVKEFRTSWYGGYTIFEYDRCGIFEDVLTVKDYEPIIKASEQYSVSFDKPVVSAKVDLAMGELSANKQYFVLDGSETWNIFNTNTGGTCFYTDIPIVPMDKRFMSSHFVDDYAVDANAISDGLFITSSLSAVYIRMAAERGITTAEQFKAWLANESAKGNPVTVVVNATNAFGVNTLEIVGRPNTNVIACADGKVTVSGNESIKDVIETRDENARARIVAGSSHTGNVSIVCAKEFTYDDGTPPQIDFFLLEECGTNRFFISRDLKSKEFAFKFSGDPSLYTFGVLKNGDVIAVRFAETLTGPTKDDNNRVNPYVFLAKENWAVQHEVDFGDALKPCGWLSNCGFRVLPDGTCLFCEYTRQTTATANVWRLVGDPIDSANWVSVKSFPITTTDNLTGFKHIHTVQYDHYSGVAYIATGDDNVGSMVYYSRDGGLTWAQLIAPGTSGEQNEHGWYEGSEKYCRLLNFTFTESHIYWATDSPGHSVHYLFKAVRDENGVLDYDTVEDYVHLPLQATYGTAYLKELNAIFLFNRADGNVDSIAVDVVDLSDGSIKTVHTLYAANETNRLLGFRTRFSEWYPHDGLVRVGFCLYATGLSNATNQNKGFGNKGYQKQPSDNVNNLWMQFRKIDGEFKVHFGTYYV